MQCILWLAIGDWHLPLLFIKQNLVLFFSVHSQQGMDACLTILEWLAIIGALLVYHP